MLCFLCDKSAGTVSASKDFAAQLVAEFDTTPEKFTVGRFDRFLDIEHELGRAFRQWASSEATTMDTQLFQELLAYGAALLVMQRLEAKHHLVNQKMTVSRNSTPQTLSANLRRRLNKDCEQKEFRDNFPRYMTEFNLLVDTPWKSRYELSRIISGYSLSIMFADLSAEQQTLIKTGAAKEAMTSSKDFLDKLAHVKSVMAEGGYYAVPTSCAPDGSTRYTIMQLVSYQPASKRYMQKVVKWSEDPWSQMSSVCILGETTSRPMDGEVISLEDTDLPQSLAVDFQFSSSACCLTEIPISDFFLFNFEGTQELRDVDHVTTFALPCDASTDGDTALVDLNLLSLG